VCAEELADFVLRHRANVNYPDRSLIMSRHATRNIEWKQQHRLSNSSASRRRARGRAFHVPSRHVHGRPLRHEALEDRCVLTSVVGLSPADGSLVVPPQLDTAANAVATLTAMDGGNGGWAVLYGEDAIASDSLQLAIDEDMRRDAERSHTSEQVAFVMFEDAPVAGANWLETGSVHGVTDSWQTVTLDNSYTSMVVVATPIYDSTMVPLVPRIRHAAGNSFEVRVDRVDGSSEPLVTGVPLQYLIIEEGVYTQAEHGVTMEAVKFTSTVTDYAGSANPDDPDNPYYDSSWIGESQTYMNAYTRPVVIGQVMTANDADFSVFWSRGTEDSITEPPTSTTLYVGKHAGEDFGVDLTTPPVRADETIGYVVLESGGGMIGGREYLAGITGDTILGMDNVPPFTYAPPCSLELYLDFDAPYDPTTLQPDDLIVSIGTVSAANIVDEDSVVYTITGLLGEDVVSVSLRENAINDTSGTAVDPFSATLYVDANRTVKVESLEAVHPLGSLVYEQSAAGAINSAGDIDQFQITLDPGQTVSVAVAPKDGLQLQVQLEGPADVLVSDAASVVGESVLLQSISTASATETYTITISDQGSGIGEYDWRVILNAAVEEEAYGGSPNDTYTDAQPLDFREFAAGGAVATVVGQADGFDNDTAITRTYTSANRVRIPNLSTVTSTLNITDSFPIADLNVALDIRHSAVGNLGVFLVGPDSKRIQLFLDIGDWENDVTDTVFDDEAPLAIWQGTPPYTGSFRPDGRLSDFDGIHIQGTWTLEIMDDHESDSGRLNSWSLTATQASPLLDSYQFQLAAGQLMTLSATGHTVDKLEIELHHDGQVVAAGVASADNLHDVIDGFAAPVAGTYYAVVKGDPRLDYTLVATLDGVFDQEGNNGIVTAQMFEATVAMGSVGPPPAMLVEPGSGGLRGGVAVNVGADGNFYVSDGFGGSVHSDSGVVLRYDRVTGAFMDAFARGAAAYGHEFVFGPDGQLYLADRNSTVFRYDLQTGAFIDEFTSTPVGTTSRPSYLTFAPDGFLYTSGNHNSINRYDAVTGEFIDVFVPDRTGGLDFPGDLDHGPDITGDSVPELYVMSRNTGQILRFDGATGAFLDVFADYYAKFQFVPDITGDGHADMYLASGSIYRLDGVTGEVIDTYIPQGTEGMNATGLWYGLDGTLLVISDEDSVLRFGGPTSDYFKVWLNEGDELELSTSTPNDGVGKALNALDPMVRLLDAAGHVLVEDDNSAADGKNAQLTYAVPPGQAGEFIIEILPSISTPTETCGEYVLSKTISQPVLPTLFVNDVVLAEGALGAATQFIFTVMRETDTTTEVFVDYSTADGSATVADNDYEPTSGTLTFAIGQTSQEVTVTVNGDFNMEDDEVFALLLTNATGGAIIQDATGTGQIVDDDTAYLSIDDVTLNEGDSGNTQFLFTVSRTGNTSRESTVNFASADGTALSVDSDYLPASGTLTFLAGQSTAEIVVWVVGDTSVEEDENFFVNLGNAHQAVIVDGQGEGLILNEDAPPFETHTSEDGPLAIPDPHPKNGPRTIESYIVIDPSETSIGSIGTLSVQLDFTHNEPKQLVASVESPSGSVVDLRVKYDPVLATYYENVGFEGEPLEGTWTLYLSDITKFEVGTLNSWSVTATPELQPLMATGTVTALKNDQPPSLTLTEVEHARNQAVAAWSEFHEREQILQIDVRISNLPDGQLGWAWGHTITVDRNANGSGWYLDQRLAKDAAFVGFQSPVGGQVDLFTVLAHEVGHVLGYGHSDNPHDLMAETLPFATRRLPGSGRVSDVTSLASPMPLPELEATVERGTVIEQSNELIDISDAALFRRSFVGQRVERTSYQLGERVQVLKDVFDEETELLEDDLLEVLARQWCQQW
jgi:subtilisin-like proprotein convertase family protein